MNALQRFDFEGTPIRVDLDAGGEPWWVITDVCDAINLTTSSRVAERLEPDEKGMRSIQTPGGPQNLLVCNEAGLYRLIFRSNKPEAARLQRWVFHDVLPALRREGTYQMHPRPSEPELALLRERETRYPDGTVVLERFDQRELEDDLDQRPASERRQLELVPQHPDADVTVLRRRFSMALKGALQDAGYLDGMSSEQRGLLLTGWNGRLKGLVMRGLGRDEWDVIHYERAVDYLLARHALDLRWIFDDQGVA